MYVWFKCLTNYAASETQQCVVWDDMQHWSVK